MKKQSYLDLRSRAGKFFSRERSSTGSNDCFVVLVLVVFYPLADPGHILFLRIYILSYITAKKVI
jgi:hypothetical protein